MEKASGDEPWHGVEEASTIVDDGTARDETSDSPIVDRVPVRRLVRPQHSGQLGARDERIHRAPLRSWPRIRSTSSMVSPT